MTFSQGAYDLRLRNDLQDDLLRGGLNMRSQIQIIGIDCAVQDKRIGLAFGSIGGESLRILDALPGRPDRILQQLKDWIDPQVPTLLAIDAPLGWPDPLGKALVNHRRGSPSPLRPTCFSAGKPTAISGSAWSGNLLMWARIVLRGRLIVH